MTFNAGIEAAAQIAESHATPRNSTPSDIAQAIRSITRPSSSAPVERRDDIESRLASSMNEVLCKMIDNKDEMVTTIITAKVIASKPFQEVIDRLSLPGSSRDEVLEEAAKVAEGPIYKERYRGGPGHNWYYIEQPGTDHGYGNGRIAAANAIRALKSGVAK